MDTEMMKARIQRAILDGKELLHSQIQEETFHHGTNSAAQEIDQEAEFVVSQIPNMIRTAIAERQDLAMLVWMGIPSGKVLSKSTPSDLTDQRDRNRLVANRVRDLCRILGLQTENTSDNTALNLRIPS